MTNPNNAIGTNGAYSGRTSVDAFNDVLSAFNGRGILSGWSVYPRSGMTVSLGGVVGIRDVAIAVATGGAKTTVNNRSGVTVPLTIDTAPATNSRIDAIVAYVSNPPQGTAELADNPSACGLIAVKGTVASSPTAPTESAIRTAITADGAVGSTAYYVVLGTVKVVAGMTTITSNYITQGDTTGLGTSKIANTAITTAKIANKAVTSDKIDFSTLVSSMKVVNWTPPYPGEEKEVYLYRIGCLVIICGTWTSESNAAYDNKAVAETLPSGYRPTQNVWIPWTTTQDSQTPFNGAWQFKPNGTVTYSCTATVNSRNTRMAVSGCWITSDDFPS